MSMRIRIPPINFAPSGRNLMYMNKMPKEHSTRIEGLRISLLKCRETPCEKHASAECLRETTVSDRAPLVSCRGAIEERDAWLAYATLKLPK